MKRGIVRRTVLALILGLCLVFGIKAALAGDGQNWKARSLPALAKNTRIVLLGTGTPAPYPQRCGPSLAVVVDDQPYIVDFGSNIVRRTQAAYKAGIPGLNINNLTRAFCTHLHSDHTMGLDDLIFTPWIIGRKNPLDVYGPTGMLDMTAHLLKAYSEDIRVRDSALAKTPVLGYLVNAYEIGPGMIYQDEKVMVEAFRVKHGAFREAYSFRFTTPELTIVISGDTTFTDNMMEYAAGCDVLIHEAYCKKNFEKLSEESKRYFASYHTSSADLARIAAAVRPRLLILYHQMHFFDSTPKDLLREIEKIYKGRVIYGQDLDIFAP
jgi:ribonuclease BN (tRNA processing enzyme)